MAATYRTEVTLQEDGQLEIVGLPYKAGQTVEVIIHATPPHGDAARDDATFEELRGSVLWYDDPFEPAVDPDDWEANR